MAGVPDVWDIIRTSTLKMPGLDPITKDEPWRTYMGPSQKTADAYAAEVLMETFELGIAYPYNAGVMVMENYEEEEAA